MQKLKLKIWLIILSALTALCLLLSACAPEGSKSKLCKVVLSDSQYYSCIENIHTVQRGGDVKFTLTFNKNYTFKGVTYSDYSVEISPPAINGERTAELTLHNVRNSVFVSVEVKAADIFNVSIEDSPSFRCEEPVQTVREGEPAVFTLRFDAEHTFDSAEIEGSGAISYLVAGADGETNEKNERLVVLKIENIRNDIWVKVNTRQALSSQDGLHVQPTEERAVVAYALNGGAYLGKETGGSYFTVAYALAHYPRPNVSIGTDMIERHGYTLTGWNTQPDGNGNHIGLGSRAAVKKGETLLLYAEWEKWTDTEQFDYVLIDAENISDLYSEKEDKLLKLEELQKGAKTDNLSAVITAYHGTNADTLAIPERLEGYPVAAVAASAVNSSDIKTVVFPLSMRYVMNRAFIGCTSLTEIYLYDNISYFDGTAFGTQSSVETLHINANAKPLYGMNESAQFANKMELLLQHENEKKTVIFGSCSIWYSVHAETFGRQTGRLALNMGVEGDTCTLAQVDLIRQHMNEGDTLIYLCDLGSPYLLGYNVSFDLRMFRMLEFNYDLLATLNLQRYENVFGALNEYLIAKDLAYSIGKSGSYDDYLECISGYGDMNTERAESENDGIYQFIPKETLEENFALRKTKELLQSFVDMGTDVYYGFGLVSEICLEKDVAAVETVEELNGYFTEQFKALNMPAKMIGSIYTSILPDGYFYNTPYRLTTEGTKYYTQKFIEYFLSAAQ